MAHFFFKKNFILVLGKLKFPSKNFDYIDYSF